MSSETGRQGRASFATTTVAASSASPAAKILGGAWLGALAMCVAASLLWSHTPSNATRLSVSDVSADAPESGNERIASSTLGGTGGGYRASIVVVLPNEHDYSSSLAIPVAGLARGRPHGPPILTVHAELRVQGQLVGESDLGVYSGRFAGTIHVTADIEAGRAELRVTDPARPSTPAAVRSLILAPRVSRHPMATLGLDHPPCAPEASPHRVDARRVAADL